MNMNRIIVILLFAIPAFAQDQVIQGTSTANGVEWDYNFTTDTTLVNYAPDQPGYGGQYVNTVMNGTLDMNDKLVYTGVDCVFQFQPGQEMAMAGWGKVVDPVTGLDEWELITTDAGSFVEFNAPLGRRRGSEDDGDLGGSVSSVVTPEPPTVLLVGIILAGLFIWRMKKQEGESR
jgi:hypothetical protein